MLFQTINSAPQNIHIRDFEYQKIGILLSLQIATILASSSTEKIQKEELSQQNYNTSYLDDQLFHHASSLFKHPNETAEWYNKTTSRSQKDAAIPYWLSKGPSFSTHLIKHDFVRFEEGMNDALVAMNNTVNNATNWEDLDWFKMIIALSFSGVGDFWEVTTGDQPPNGTTCHLMVPKGDEETKKDWFFFCYGLCYTNRGMRELAKQELANMIAEGLGEDLRDYVPTARRLFRIFIAFHGPAGAVEHEGPVELREPDYTSIPSTEIIQHSD
ncbi:uncharacterized protein [Bemisia tabaci]|uniref:uncharacterized protein n=1 Tax=Bemisia tabaci TaxID=7038 RepID=UPI003B28938F